jgi:hypothetical protein
MGQSFRDLETTTEASLRQLRGYCAVAEGPAPVTQHPVGAINRRVVFDNFLSNKQAKGRLPGRRAGVNPAPR